MILKRGSLTHCVLAYANYISDHPNNNAYVIHDQRAREHQLVEISVDEQFFALLSSNTIHIVFGGTLHELSIISRLGCAQLSFLDNLNANS